MPTLFNAADRSSIALRLVRLEASSPRAWGTMTSAQMLTHCSRALETATGERPMKQKLIGRILAPLVRKSVLGEARFKRGSPTDPAFVVKDDRDFAKEREHLERVVDRFCQGGPSAAEPYVHAFFGKLSGDEWGALMYKHLDHHLRQFGV